MSNALRQRSVRRLAAWALFGAIAASIPVTARSDDAFHFSGLPKCTTAAPAASPCQSRLPLGTRQRSAAPAGLSVRAHGDLLDVTYRGMSSPFAFGDAPYLGGDLQTFLQEDGGGLWTARIRIPELDRAVLDISLANVPSPPQPVAFQGPHADHAAVHTGRPATRSVRETLHSEALGVDRDIYVYRGRDCISTARRCTLVILADGDTLDTFLDNAPPTAGGIVDNLVLVGVSGPSGKDAWEARIGELLFAVGQPQAERFESFVLHEVIPHVEGRDAPLEARWVAGYSNGGAWAVDMALRHPEVFTGALGFSVASATKTWSAPTRAPAPAPQFLLGAGSLETKFKEQMTIVARGLSGLGLHVEQRLFTGGHSLSTWNALFWFYLPQVATGAA